MFPSFGSTSRPADVPHFRPAGSSPQLRVTFGAGFGSPSPVMGFVTFVAPCAHNVFEPSPQLIEAVKTKTTQAPNVESRIRGVGMAPPRAFQIKKAKSTVFLTPGIIAHCVLNLR